LIIEQYKMENAGRIPPRQMLFLDERELLAALLWLPPHGPLKPATRSRLPYSALLAPEVRAALERVKELDREMLSLMALLRFD
jgi:hypothetical protein